MQPPSLPANFFSSLKQVEKRLKSEHSSQPSNPPPPLPSPPPSPPPPPLPPPPPPQQQSLLSVESTNYASTESLSSPIFLHFDQQLPNHSSSLQESSDHEPPSAFFSSASPPFPPTHQNPPPSTSLDHPKPTNEAPNCAIDDIKKLIQILGLSDCEGVYKEQEGPEKKRGSCGDGLGEYEGGFYAKIVGVKGPKCGKEVERLDGWIKHFLNNGGGGEGKKRERLRLAHLLLGKAAVVLEVDDADFGGLEFPSTVNEFLHHDPPKY